MSNKVQDSGVALHTENEILPSEPIIVDETAHNPNFNYEFMNENNSITALAGSLDNRARSVSERTGAAARPRLPS